MNADTKHWLGTHLGLPSRAGWAVPVLVLYDVLVTQGDAGNVVPVLARVTLHPRTSCYITRNIFYSNCSETKIELNYLEIDFKYFIQSPQYPRQVLRSVVDPDPYVFGPLGSGSVSQRYRSGSGSSSSKNSMKNLDFNCSVTFYDFLS
jgi:hypothetical protein